MLHFKQFIVEYLTDKQGEEYSDKQIPVFPNYIHGVHAHDKLQEASLDDYVEKHKELDDVEDLHDILVKNHRDLPYHPNVEQVRKYTEQSSTINRGLLNAHKKGVEPSKQVAKKSEAISKAITTRPAPHDMHVYSAIGFNPAKHMNSDRRMHSPAFISSTLHPHIADNFHTNGMGDMARSGVGHILKIKIPKGSRHGAYIDHVSANDEEKEFLINKGKTLKINPRPIKLHDDEGNHTHSIWHATLEDSNEKPTSVSDKPNQTPKPKKTNEVDEGLDNGDSLAGMNALRKPKATAAHLSKALDHASPHVRLSAIRHPKANIQHIQKALKDKHDWIKDEAKRLLLSK